MQWLDRLSLFSLLDLVALVVFMIAWGGIGWRIEREASNHPSVSILMNGYRREWMRQFVDRDPRIFDAQILSNLRQGTAFFASATMIALGGGLALVGNSDQLAGLASDFALESQPILVWDIKIVAVLFVLVNAFLKFVWAQRLFGYCAVVMSAVPNAPDDPAAMPRAMKAAEINIRASRGFNRGLRAVYFTMAMATWLVGPLVLLVSTAVTVSVLWRREFSSVSRSVLIETLPEETLQQK